METGDMRVEDHMHFKPNIDTSFARHFRYLNNSAPD